MTATERIRRLKQARQAGNLRDVIGHLHGDLPGSEFDDLFRDVKLAMQLDGVDAPHPGELVIGTDAQAPAAWAKATLLYLGHLAAKAIVDDEDGLLRLACAAAKWRAHCKARGRKSVFSTIEAILALRCRGRGPYAMRDIVAELKAMGVDVNEDTRKRVRRKARQLGVMIRGRAGRPRRA